jgi:hypothetical protein
LVCRHSYASAQQALQLHHQADMLRTPVLLVTDIGADIDDTLALLVCLVSNRLTTEAVCCHLCTA